MGAAGWICHETTVKFYSSMSDPYIAVLIGYALHKVWEM